MSLKYFLIAAVCILSVNAGTWTIIDSDILTTDAGVAFIDERTGYTAGDANGIGPAIMKSTDGGVHFETCNATFGIDLLLLDVDAAGSTAVVSSVFGELYTDNNGNTFQPSRGGGISQSVRFLGINGDGGKKYGVAGTYRNIQGVGISVDGGKTFTAYDAKLVTQSRYGAFPTDDIWYISAGEWPDTTSTSTQQQKQARRHFRYRKSEFQNADGRFPLSYTPPNVKGNTPGYVAQISKTIDGGKTWVSQFLENGTFYFNGIDCAPNNASHCCAVGEASGSADAGARIYCTVNGGNNWTRTFWEPATQNQGFSVMEIRFVSEKNIFVVGAEYGAIAPSAWFLQSTDGGNTWDHSARPIKGSVALSLSMVNANLGYAALDNVITQESSIAKYQ